MLAFERAVAGDEERSVIQHEQPRRQMRDASNNGDAATIDTGLQVFGLIW